MVFTTSPEQRSSCWGLDAFSIYSLFREQLSKIELFARFLKLAFPGQSTFTRLQKRYLVPAVDELWTAKQTTIVEELTHQDLVILGKINICWGGGCINIIIYAFIEICSPEIL